MALLKKIKGSTLMETLVSTVLIVILFMISSLVLNSFFESSLKQKRQTALKERLYQLEYEIINKVIQLPYSEVVEPWDVAAYRSQDESTIVIEVLNAESNKRITKKIAFEN